MGAENQRTGNEEGHMGRPPLKGIKVVDLTRALAGPFCTLTLANLGAEIIKIEDPKGGDISRNNAPYIGPDGLKLARQNSEDFSLAALNRLRGKQSITLDLKHPKAAGIFSDLVANADVVVENFSAGTADRLGVGYSAAKRANESIIYCSLTGYGGGNSRGMKAMDAVIQALSGLMMVSGGPDDPPIRIGVPIADVITPMWATIGILAALNGRNQTGKGQFIDVSMLGALTSFVAMEDWDALYELGQPLRSGPTLPRLAPFGLYRCADGWVSLVAPQDRLVEKLFSAMGRAELLRDPRFVTRDSRVVNETELTQEIESWSSSLPVSTVVEQLVAAGVPAGPVVEPREAVRNTLVVERSDTMPVTHPDLGNLDKYITAGLPVHFSDAPSGDITPAPRLGEHTDKILSDLLGYTSEQIDALRKSGAI